MKFYLLNLWKFARPHTIIGTSLSVLAIYLVALGYGPESINWSFSQLGKLLVAWWACLGGNVYIVGLNQLYDVEIDQVNKPDLPLASGKFSIAVGRWIVGIAGLLSIGLAALGGRWLLLTVVVSLIIGTAYSLPPIRLKRFPLLAAFCILVVRGLVVNLGLFAYFSQLLERQELLPPIAWVLTLFVLVFTVAIAIFKDVPDLEGDRQYQIQTFTLLIGKQAIFEITRWAITLAYVGVIGASLLFLPTMNHWFFIGYHCVLIGLLWFRSQHVNLNEIAGITDFYQFIWQLFFLEYLLFPIACFVPSVIF
jgi:homogentisate phytyltransferase / homogentisate geranylgeranyltransferase